MTNNKNKNALKAVWLDTKLGFMLAIASEKHLYSLKFANHKNINISKIKHPKQKTKPIITSGYTQITDLLEEQLDQYFNGTLSTFNISLFVNGTSFQKAVWNELKNIPMGKTRSYTDIAVAIGNPLACRAVAQANAANQFSIIIPCHRVINKNGNLSGYNSDLELKEWLLNHEKQKI